MLRYLLDRAAAVNAGKPFELEVGADLDALTGSRPAKQTHLVGC